MRTAKELCDRVNELYLEHINEEYVVGIDIHELKVLVNENFEQKRKIMTLSIEAKRQKQLADAIYADAMLQQDKFKVIERV